MEKYFILEKKRLEKSIENEKIVSLKIHKFSSGEIKIILDSNEKIEKLERGIFFYYAEIGEKLVEKDFELLIALDFVRRFSEKIILVIPYLTNSRQDKETPGKTESITLKTWLKLLKETGVQRIICLDIHSKKAEEFSRELGIEFTSISHHKIFYDVLKKEKVDIVLAPDKGARKRAEELAKKLECSYVVAEKKRDYEKGTVEGIYVKDKEKLKGEIVIVDDIIGSGGTIKKLVEELELKNAILAVSHLTISKKGAETLLELFKKRRIKLLLTTDSVINENIKMLDGLNYKIINSYKIIEEYL